jgi:type I restriction enzyme S subunit
MRHDLRAANVTWSGLALNDVMEMNFEPEEVERHRLVSGDIVLSEASGSASEVGKPALWKGEIEDCCFQNTLLRVRPRSSMSTDFLLLVFREAAISGRFAQSSRGVGIHHLGKATLAAWPIPIPPRDDQDRTIQEVERYLSVVAVLERVVAQALAR